MKVFCLFKGYSYEGDNLLGIFTSLEKANFAAKNLVEQSGENFELMNKDCGCVHYENRDWDGHIYTQIWEVE